MDPAEQSPSFEIGRAKIPIEFDLTEIERQKQELDQFATELRQKLSDALNLEQALAEPVERAAEKIREKLVEAFDPERLLGPLERRLEGIARQLEALSVEQTVSPEAPDRSEERRERRPEDQTEDRRLPSAERFEQTTQAERQIDVLDEIKQEVEEIKGLVQILAGGSG